MEDRGTIRLIKDPGFWIIDNVLSHTESDRILEAISQNRKVPGLAGTRNLMSVKAVSLLAGDSRLTGIAAEIMGCVMIPFKATLFEKTGKANWLVAFHQDTALPLCRPTVRDGWGPHSVKEGIVFAHAPTRALTRILALRVHLDASDEDNGPLRVIPSTHHRRITDEDEFTHAVRLKPAVKCLVEKGGVIAMSPLIIHASSKSANHHPRRVLHIEYTSTMEIDSDVFLTMT